MYLEAGAELTCFYIHLNSAIVMDFADARARLLPIGDGLYASTHGKAASLMAHAWTCPRLPP